MLLQAAYGALGGSYELQPIHRILYRIYVFLCACIYIYIYTYMYVYADIGPCQSPLPEIVTEALFQICSQSGGFT